MIEAFEKRVSPLQLKLVATCEAEPCSLFGAIQAKKVVESYRPHLLPHVELDRVCTACKARGVCVGFDR